MIIRRIPWSVQPQGVPRLNDALRASDVWVGSHWGRTLVRSAPTVVTSTSFVPTSHGVAASFTASGTSSVQLTDTRFTLLPNGGNFSIAILRRSRDTTARNTTLFGYNSTTSDRVLAHAPYGDGTLYWDGGNNTAGSGRVSVSFTKRAQWETLIFYAGARGREVWRDGVRIASNASALATLSGSTVAAFTLGNCAAVGSDADDIALAVIAGGYDWSLQECEAWGKKPWERTFYKRRALVSLSFATGGQTASIAQVNETDTAQALTAVVGAVTAAISQVSSTETAQALTATTGTTTTIAQVASTETAQSLTATTTVTTAITAAQESDAAQSITAATSITTAITQVASTETAQSVTATNASTVAITQAQSTETAQALTAAATKTQAITQVASTETAQAITAVQPGVFTAANETDTAQALSVVATRTVAIGQVASTETAQALTPVLTTTTGITLALEIDAAQALASIVSQSVAVTQAQSTETARALTVFFEGGALDTVALYSIVTQLVSLSSKQTRTRSGDSYIAPVVSRDSHLGD